MDKKKVGAFLAGKRLVLGLSEKQMSNLLGCNRTTVMRIEKGLSGIRRNNVANVAQAYQVSIKELTEMCDYETSHVPDAPMLVTTEDLKFLVTVSEGLKTPMSMTLIYGLLSHRKQSTG
ncbi:MAG: helix-turn-helix transcriptional regulator [bacterium]|nr:helix-turn-helix transcriptional regulator [bacterium]